MRDASITISKQEVDALHAKREAEGLGFIIPLVANRQLLDVKKKFC